MGVFDEEIHRAHGKPTKRVCCCLVSFAIIGTLVVVVVVAFCIVRPVAIAVDAASLTRLSLVSTGTPADGGGATALACNLTVLLTVRNPNWAMRIRNTEPLEAVYSFAGHRFNRVQLAGVGSEQGAKERAVYRMTSGADSALVALDDAGVAEYSRQSAAGVFELEVVVSGEIKYTPRFNRCRIQASCPLKLRPVSPWEALLLHKVKCKLINADKNC